MLTIVGDFVSSEFPSHQMFDGRVEYRSGVPHDQLCDELNRFDINVAPLEVANPYCEAKSEIKFSDAAALAIPTVASPTEPFLKAIRSGHNGFVAGTSEEWKAGRLP